MSEWQTMENAPKGDEPIRARIPGYGDENIIVWLDGLEDSDGNECGGWAVHGDQTPPDCWTDGVCWAVNENGVPSVSPTHWAKLPPMGADQ